MPYNMLVTTCLLENTSCKRQGVKVYANRKRGEKILFFEIDENPNTKSGFRPFCYGKQNLQREKICDLLVYYTRDKLKYDIICLVELKNTITINLIKNACDQILQTKDGLRPKLDFSEYGEPKPLVWAAYICYKRPISSEIDFEDDELEGKKGELNINFKKWKMLEEANIGYFLRNVADKLKD